MSKPNELLYVTDGQRDNVESLSTLKKLLSIDDCTIRVVAMIPEIPKKLIRYSDQFRSSVLARLQADVGQVFTEEGLKVQCEVKCTDHPASEIVKLAAREGYTCVIKQAESKLRTNKGFEAIDMSLLRKTPCPLLLIKQNVSQEKVKLAVAIDAENNSPVAIDLSVKLLQNAATMASPNSLPIDVVSCWESVVENAQNEPFVNLTEAEIAKDCKATQGYQLKNLKHIIAESEIVESSFAIRQIKGDPDSVIPNFVTENNIACLLLGTYSRRGLKGVFLGNTAENVLANIACSVLVVKPSNFASKIDPY